MLLLVEQLELIGIRHIIRMEFIDLKVLGLPTTELLIPLMQQDTDTISDIVWVTPNPSDPNKFIASSWSGGLLSFNNNDLEERFTFHNSSLQTRIGGNGYCVFASSATCFDN